jgi:hypothetical protein
MRDLRHWAAALIPCMGLLAGCGSGFPSSDRSGSGTDTLEVVVRIDASPAAGETAAHDDELHTTYEVDVRGSSGYDLTGATVIVDSPRGIVTLVEAAGCDRRYCGSQVGYAGVYGVSVVRNDDVLDGVFIHGPSLHTVGAPSSGATVDASLPLEVRWSPSGQAHTTEVRTRDYEADLEIDPGSFQVPAHVLRTRDDRPEDERVRVRRARQLVLTGGLPGSNAQVAVRNGVAFFTQPVP